MRPDLNALETALLGGQAAPYFNHLTPAEHAQASTAALALGFPDVAAQLSPDPLVQAAAFLRLGQPGLVLEVLDGVAPSARASVLQARAHWQLDETDALPRAQVARQLARQEGDAGAIVAAAALIGEMQLSEPRTALRSLAEGLKVAEVIGEEADAYLLAVLAHAQKRSGGRSKAAKTAKKALTRSPERSPARVVALLALNQPDEAKKVASAGKLGNHWIKVFQDGD